MIPPLKACDAAAWRLFKLGIGRAPRRLDVEGRLYLPVRVGDVDGLARWALEGEPRPSCLLTGPDAPPILERSGFVRRALMRAGSERTTPARLAWPRMAAEKREDPHRQMRFFAGWAGSPRRRESFFRRGRAQEIGPDGVFATWRMGRLPHWLDEGELVEVIREGAWVFGGTYQSGQRFASYVPVVPLDVALRALRERWGLL